MTCTTIAIGTFVTGVVGTLLLLAFMMGANPKRDGDR